MLTNDFQYENIIIMENKIVQTEIARRAKVSPSALSNILKGRRRPSWSMAKKLAKATGTSPILWLEGSTEQIRLELTK